MNVNDPRVKRTRDLLIKSFQELLEEKHNVYSISVQEIAKRASLNRATFYAHFEDRYAFLEYWMRIKFKKILEAELQNALISDIGGLKTVMLSVFNFLDKFRRYMTPTDVQFEPLFEASMQNELHRLILKWLGEVSGPDVTPELLDATAICASWSIFGSAVQWSRNPNSRTAESMVRDVLVVVAAGLSPIIG